MPKGYLFLRALVVLASVFTVRGQTPGGNGVNRDGVVSIPVIVINRSGDLVTGLDAASFSITEGGQYRPVESAVEVAAVTVGKKRDKVPFVVLDAIGSSSEAQAQARKECLQVLANAVADGLQISLSEIDRDGLHMIHEVSTPSSVLVSALLQLDTETHVLTNRDQLQAVPIATEEKSLVVAETDRLRSFRRGTIDNANMMRTFLTQLRAFQQIAGALQRAPGRKTVIWLTGYFPIEVDEGENSINIDSYGISSNFPVKSASIDYQRTVNLLNDAHISIFPVQLEGSLRTNTGLHKFARATSGEVMANTRDLGSLVRQAEDRSSSYYLLTFQPEKIATALKWAKLKVQLKDPSARVISPNGLFVFPPPK